MKNGLRIWRNIDYPDAEWDISLYPDWHNNTPDLTRNPDLELSPWAQRGAPSNTGPQVLISFGYNDPDTHMTQPSIIQFPNVVVTGSQGNGYVDVTVTATDESGINRLYFMLPGSSTWTLGIQQPQHPISDTYSETVRLSAPGTFYYYAMDNGGNYPSTAPGIIITMPPTYTVTPTPTVSSTPTPTPTSYLGSSVIFPNPVKETMPVVLHGFLPSTSDVKIQLYTLGFRNIQEQVFLQVPTGSDIKIEIKDKWGTYLANGLYYVVITTNQGRTIKKLLITR